MSERPLKARLKTKKNRTASQKRWLERQLNDPYVARAKREGMRSRAAYKLIEVDDKYHLLKGGARVVDLGAAPGGWSEVAAKRVGAGEGRGKVVAIDVLEMKPMAGVDFMRLDIKGRSDGEAVFVIPADIEDQAAFFPFAIQADALVADIAQLVEDAALLY